MRVCFPKLVLIATILAGTSCLLFAADASSPRFDGPAELPRVSLKTSLADTPAPGKIHAVKAGGDFQDALDHASCGDTITLQAGATFSGRFRLRQKNCDDSHWIIIRTSAGDSELPAEGSRLTPCYAGVASLPGRPDLHCTSTKNVLARLVFTGKAGEGPVIFDSGANHYRLLGLEITRAETDDTITALIAPEVRCAANHIVLDRLWVHGTSQAETTRGVYLTGTADVAVVDSSFTDFHCISVSGTCTDSQAIGGGGGDFPSGPYKIVNNFLEASGENILFGGGRATITPTDIEIRHNYLFKPLTWKPGQPGFVGGKSGRPFIVKNLFELKNAQRVLFEGNILEDNWGGVGQQGFAIVLTPRNQVPNVCPLCRVTDVTLRYCRILHTASGMNIANAPSDTGGISTAGERYSIHDLIFDDIDGEFYKGFGAFAMVISNGPPLHDVKIDHVTAFPSRVALILRADTSKPRIQNFALTNSILGAGEREVTSTGGKENCAFGAAKLGPAAVLKTCFDSSVFAHNAIIRPLAAWPSENFSAKSEDSVGFVNFSGGKNGDYRLCNAKGQPASCKQVSPYIHAGSDGKDLGADVNAVVAATRGVA